jgi:hypothetical protein
MEATQGVSPTSSLELEVCLELSTLLELQKQFLHLESPSIPERAPDLTITQVGKYSGGGGGSGA